VRPGALHVYLGAAPGVGKTYAMLVEGRRLADAGVDVVAGWVDTHGRMDTGTLAMGLERMAPHPVVYRDTVFDEMDLDGLLERRPAVVLVDELAHANVPGSRHHKRWQDVEELLGDGIGVITTVNVQHVDSLKEAVARVTGTVARETVPDSFLASAARIDFVDVDEEVLRRRVEDGAVFAPEAAGLALGGLFNAAHLTVLRDLARRWLDVLRTGPSAGSPFESEAGPDG